MYKNFLKKREQNPHNSCWDQSLVSRSNLSNGLIRAVNLTLIFIIECVGGFYKTSWITVDLNESIPLFLACLNHHSYNGLWTLSRHWIRTIRYLNWYHFLKKEKYFSKIEIFMSNESTNIVFILKLVYFYLDVELLEIFVFIPYKI